MTNATRGITTLDVDGKVLKLQYTTNAMCELEDAAKVGFMEFLSAFQAGAEQGTLRIAELRLLLWAGLIEHQPDTTLKTAGAVIDALGGLETAMDQLSGALQAALPRPDKAAAAGAGDAGNAPAAA